MRNLEYATRTFISPIYVWMVHDQLTTLYSTPAKTIQLIFLKFLYKYVTSSSFKLVL